MYCCCLHHDDDRNSEKRKEKSRKAARERRSQESKIFDEIESILPVPAKTLDSLDKASLVRVAINYLKLRSVVDPFKVPEVKNEFDFVDPPVVDALNGFVFVFSKDGDIIYLSDNVERCLGLSQIDLIGQNIYDYSHPCDHDDLKLLLEPLTNAFNASKLSQNCGKKLRRPNCPISGLADTTGPYFIRMKSTINTKGRNSNLKSANFKVIKCSGRLIDLASINPDHAQMIGENFRQYMIGIGELIQHPSRLEIPLMTDVFMSKHSPDMKFVYADESIETLFGFKSAELIGQSFYQYFDANDFMLMNDFFKTLFAKGQCDSGFFKFLVKTGGHRWISTQATVITEPNSNQPQSIILINRVISGVEHGHLITSDVQQEPAQQQQQSVPLRLSSTVQLNQPYQSVTASVIKPRSSFESFDNHLDSIPELASNFQKTILSCKDESETGQDLHQQQQQQQPSVTLCVPGGTGPSENCFSSTATVLAPKTADMESGFLMFTEDNKGMTVLTDADDLTHLAPDAGDLCVPMLTDMDFNDLNMLDDIFLNSTSFNINGSTMTDDDLLNSLENGCCFESSNVDKLDKMDMFDNLNLIDTDGFQLKGCFTPLMPDNDSNSSKSSIGNNYDQQFLSNDPFLSFGTSTNDDLLSVSGSPVTPSSCSMLSDPYSSSSNSPSSGSSASSSMRMSGTTNLSGMGNNRHNHHHHHQLHFSPNSSTSSCGDDGGILSDKSLCDTTDFDGDKELDMRAPFIPIDDDFLLNDFAYSDTNMDDLFDWISNGNVSGTVDNTISNGNLNGTKKLINSNDFSNKLETKSKSSSSKTACLEALLQNDELVCSLKHNKIYNSNQLLNRTDLSSTLNSNVPSSTLIGRQSTPATLSGGVTQQQQQRQQQAQSHSLSPMKRKNSNILIYTTMNPSGEKKFKNLVLTADNIHVHGCSTPQTSTSSIVQPITLKTNANSVLLNLLVNGSDLPNGYEIIHPSYQQHTKMA
ncbi:Hypoxia-inducible factor 1-alpha [Blomia tropicalis]|nr:Hypoxia-inducible factor 1-alpha [Blomia tropicalis]